jgi:hypothetical protein
MDAFEIGGILIVLVLIVVGAIDQLHARDAELRREHRRRMEAESRYQRLINEDGRRP